jgi:hypothetical protein
MPLETYDNAEPGEPMAHRSRTLTTDAALALRDEGHKWIEPFVGCVGMDFLLARGQMVIE